MKNTISEKKEAGRQCEKAAAWLKKVDAAPELQMELEDVARMLYPKET